MKAIALRYGSYAAALVIVLSLVAWLWERGKTIDYSTTEIWGYLTLVASMVFVYLGIRHYRDSERGGYLSFGDGIKLGVLIVLIPSLAFGLYNVVYTEWLNPEFMEAYFNQNLEQLRAQLPAEEYARQEKDLLAQKEMFQNPFLGFALMFFTVFIIGLIASIISTIALLRNPPRSEGGGA